MHKKSLTIDTDFYIIAYIEWCFKNHNITQPNGRKKKPKTKTKEFLHISLLWANDDVIIWVIYRQFFIYLFLISFHRPHTSINTPMYFYSNFNSKLFLIAFNWTFIVYCVNFAQFSFFCYFIILMNSLLLTFYTFFMSLTLTMNFFFLFFIIIGCVYFSC